MFQPARMASLSASILLVTAQAAARPARIGVFEAVVRAEPRAVG